MEKTFFKKISTDLFVKENWHKLPGHWPMALPQIATFAEWDDFIEMAQDGDFEARLVYEAGGKYPWETKEGPFEIKDFKPQALWTLFCHHIELYNADFYSLKEELNFIPDWHFDDVMASVSKKGASVGAHIDDYSVFIIQAHGERKWLLEDFPNPEYQENLDIKLLKNFKPNREIILRPGDVLYIPAKVAHHGISLTDSISYSLGFKSLRYRELLDVWASELIAAKEDAVFDNVPAVEVNAGPLEISEETILKIQADILAQSSSREIMRASILKHLSRPSGKSEDSNLDIDRNEIVSMLKEKQKFQRDLWAKMVVSKRDVAVNGQIFQLQNETINLLNKYFLANLDTFFQLSDEELLNSELVDFVSLLIENKIFYFS